MSRGSIDQLRGYAYAISRVSNAPLKDIADPKILCDLLYLDRFPFVDEGRIASDNEQAANA